MEVTMMVKKGRVCSWVIAFKCSEETNPAEKRGRAGELPELQELLRSPHRGDTAKGRKQTLLTPWHICQLAASPALWFQDFNGFTIKIYLPGTDV